ncbi:MAG: hypothetical protein ACJASL_003508, partial [Paraglaciecola sp.]
SMCPVARALNVNFDSHKVQQAQKRLKLDSLGPQLRPVELARQGGRDWVLLIKDV